MLSVSKPQSGDQAKRYYYEKDPLFNPDVLSAGRWEGKTAEALGLSGRIEKTDWEAVLDGKDPRTGNVLVSEKFSSKEGEKVHRAGVDLTINAPKSVSIAALVGKGDQKIIDAFLESGRRFREIVEQRYLLSRQSVDGEYKAIKTGSALWAVYEHSTARAVKNGEHISDPHLHQHNFLGNITQRPDGNLGAVFNDLIYKEQKELGRIQRNEFAYILKKLGYEIEITDRKESFFELKAMPKELNEDFSRRRQIIEQTVKELKESGMYKGASDGRLKEIANLQTKEAKDHSITENDLQREWTNTVEARGYTVEQLNEMIQPGKEKEIEQAQGMTARDAIIKAAEIVTKSESVFTEINIVDKAIALSFGDHSYADIAGAFQEVVKNGEILKIGEMMKGKSGLAWGVYSTPEMISIERKMIDVINQSKDTQNLIFDKERIDAFIEAKQQRQGWNYKEGQKNAIQAVLGANSWVIIQGFAGTGKSKAMGAINEFVKEAGIAVRGLGFTGKAAKELQKEGIESKTLHSFLAKGEIDKGREIWIIDEASMVSSRLGIDILEKAAEHGAKVAIVGDVRQFNSIGAGRFFADIQEHATVPTIEMTEIIRQRTEHMQQVVAALQTKETDRALDVLAGRGNIIVLDNRDEIINAVVDKYFESIKKNQSIAILTNTNKVRAEINAEIRGALIEQGKIKEGRTFEIMEAATISDEFKVFADAYHAGQILVTNETIGDIGEGQRGTITEINKDKNSITVEFKDGTAEIELKDSYDKFQVYEKADREFSEGDKIVFLKNDDRLGVVNGAQAEIKSIDDRGNVVAKTDDGKDVRFNLNEGREKGDHRYNYQCVDHAYAITPYKSQGGTYDNAVWLVDTNEKNTINHNALDVAATRVRDNFQIITDSAEELRELVQAEQFKSSTLDHPEPKEMENVRAYERELVLSL
ncbi:MAG: MobF family relaxase [Nitrospirota bacterium]